MKIKRGNKKSKVLPVFFIIIAILASSVAIALIWQTIQDKFFAEPEFTTSLPSLSQVIKSSQSSSQPPQGLPSSSASSQSKTGYDYSKPVPLSERVSSEYFDDVMMVGDSITDGITKYSVMSNATVVASTGVNLDALMRKELIKIGDQNYKVIDAMKLYQPKSIYIMLGANGIGALSNEKNIELYTLFLDEVIAQHPNAKIYLQSVIPINETKYHVKYTKDYNNKVSNKLIDDYNSKLQALAQQKKVYYLNVAEAFKDADGQLPDKATSDGLHFNAQYYTVWFDYLKTHIAMEE